MDAYVSTAQNKMTHWSQNTLVPRVESFLIICKRDYLHNTDLHSTIKRSHLNKVDTRPT
jgi:hypothetical protein